MKVRTWQHKVLPLRVIERRKDDNLSYDVQVRKHHIWCNSATNLTRKEAEEIIGGKFS